MYIFTADHGTIETGGTVEAENIQSAIEKIAERYKNIESVKYISVRHSKNHTDKKDRVEIK
jgi:hypothetical protein